MAQNTTSTTTIATARVRVEVPATHAERVAAVSISSGNSKTGNIPSFSTMPGGDPLFTKDGRAYAVNGKGKPIAGTCGKNCAGCIGHCYAVKAMRYNNVLQAYAMNTAIKRADRSAIVDAINAFLSRNPSMFFRIHVSGELQAGDICAIWAPLAISHPETIFYGYTHNYDEVCDVQCAIDEGPCELDEWPANLRLTISADNLAQAISLRRGDYIFEAQHVFIYDDGSDADAAALPHCPAVDARGRKTGVTCAQCRRCINCAEPMTAVYAH